MRLELARQIHTGFESAGIGEQQDIKIAHREENDYLILVKTGCLPLLLCAVSTLAKSKEDELAEIAALTLDTMIINGYMRVY